MCHSSCLDFGKRYLTKDDVEGKSCLEVGSMNVNGSLRSLAESFNPGSYIGVDISLGPGVDELCEVSGLTDRFGKNCFDLVINTEMLEHVKDWRSAISNLKSVLKPDGVLIITTRSFGFPYHGYPFDFWRYEQEDMRVLFSDMVIESLESDPDPMAPGVFMKARKTSDFKENTLQDHKLYSVVTFKHSKDITNYDLLLFKLKNFYWSAVR